MVSVPPRGCGITYAQLDTGIQVDGIPFKMEGAGGTEDRG